MKQVKSPEDVPVGKHYAVVEFHKITESSGWGPENDSQIVHPEYYVTEDQKDWIKYIESLEARRRDYSGFVPYVAFEVKSKAVIETQINIKVN